MIKVKITF